MAAVVTHSRSMDSGNTISRYSLFVGFGLGGTTLLL